MPRPGRTVSDPSLNPGITFNVSNTQRSNNLSPVITSYSIHYTKLYDILVSVEAGLGVIAREAGVRAFVRELGALNQALAAMAAEVFLVVITSYSIHYTKLYEVK